MGLARNNKQIETWAFQSTIRQKPKRGKKKNEEKYRNLKAVLKGKMFRVMMRILK